MPQALSTHPEPYQHHWPAGDLYLGWTYPPKDYQKWRALVHEWVKHCLDRYGRPEVASWYWEIWNEPNIRFFWQPTPDVGWYVALLGRASEAIRAVDGSAVVVAGSLAALSDALVALGSEGLPPR